MSKDKSGLGSDKVSKLLFKMALPAILAQVVNLLYNLVDRMFIGRIPNIGALALTGVGLTQGSQPVISYNFGAGNLDRVRDTFKLLLKWSIAYSTLLWLFIMFKPIIFARIFTTDIDLILMVIPSLRIFMSMSFLFSIQIACQQTFISLGYAKISIFLALLRKVVLLIPLIYIMPIFLTGNKVNAVFLAEPISDTIAVIVTSIAAYVNFKTLFYNGDQSI